MLINGHYDTIVLLVDEYKSIFCFEENANKKELINDTRNLIQSKQCAKSIVDVLLDKIKLLHSYSF